MKQKLTDARVRNAKPPKTGQLEIWDTAPAGLHLRVSYGGKKAFALMTRLHGRQRRYTLGAYPAMTLGEARAKARDYLEEVAQGRDPNRTVQRADANTVKARIVNGGAKLVHQGGVKLVHLM